MNKDQRGFTHIYLMIVAIILILAGAFALVVYKQGHVTFLDRIAADDCKTWVKKIEGDKYSSIYKLDCALKPTMIANSSLNAKHLEYTGSIKGGCPIPIESVAPPPGCTTWDGIVLSNGKTYPGMGASADGNSTDFDKCYSSKLNDTAASTRDLYLYKDTLYDRYIYKNKVGHTLFGDCALNGTTLSAAGGSDYLTNVKITYSNVPTDCYTALIGKDGNDYQDCINIVTAANLQLDMCHSNNLAVFTNKKITSFRTELQVYNGQYTTGNCVEVYTQRLADLNKCDLTNDVEIKQKCQSIINETKTFLLGDNI